MAPITHDTKEKRRMPKEQ